MQASYRELYNEHPEYMAIRNRSGRVWDKYRDDVLHYKNKYLSCLASGVEYRSVLELGCATGFLLQNFPGSEDIQRVGIDIATENIDAARRVCPSVEFFAGTLDDYRTQHPDRQFDLVLMSDILEHVEDDCGLIKSAIAVGKYVLVNLPLEKVGENQNRVYGIHDREGHLRAYSLSDAFQLFDTAGLTVLKHVEAQYVREPIFRKYLFKKLVKEAKCDRLEGLIQYQEELIHIENNPGFYKTNLFALLCRASDRK